MQKQDTYYYREEVPRYDEWSYICTYELHVFQIHCFQARSSSNVDDAMQYLQCAYEKQK